MKVLINFLFCQIVHVFYSISHHFLLQFSLSVVDLFATNIVLKFPKMDFTIMIIPALHDKHNLINAFIMLSMISDDVYR